MPRTIATGRRVSRSPELPGRPPRFLNAAPLAFPETASNARAVYSESNGGKHDSHRSTLVDIVELCDRRGSIYETVVLGMRR